MTGAVARPYDLSACRTLMRGGSKSFFAASRLLPARVRAPATALYAFCRVADDAIDLDDNPAAAAFALLDRLERVYERAPLPIDADRALADVVETFGIPQPLPAALIEGFAWDAQGRRYDTIEALHDYAARVAGTVGAMMAVIMGTRSPQALARACELGVAMQLTNIARDVGEDARNGRLYLPRDWLREAGIDPDAWLERPSFSPALAGVVARLLVEADRLYERAERGIALLPRDCRPAIAAARWVYAEIGREVERAGLDSVSTRAVVPTSRKLALLARGAWTYAAAAEPDGELAPLPAIRYLVEAAGVAADGAGEAAARRRIASRAPSYYQRTVRVLELFETLAQRNRLAPIVRAAGELER